MDDEEVITPITEWPVMEREENGDKLVYGSGPKLESVSSKRKLIQQVHMHHPRKKLCINEHEELMANIAIAKWWRRKGTELKKEIQLPESTNPNTLLRAVSRSKEGMLFIESEIKRLKEKLVHNKESAALHACLASFLEKRQCFEEAKNHFDVAVQLQPLDQEFKWHLGRINKQLQIQRCQEELAHKLLPQTSDKDKQTPVQVERVPVESLSSLDFFNRYSSKRKPVVITGLVEKMTSQPWNLQHIKHIAGGLNVTLKRRVAESSEWAKLEDYTCATVEEYITNIDSDEQSQQSYLFDWSLPIHCPQLMKELTMPKYFKDNYLQRTSPGSLYADSWPSLFIAPEGLCSDLHVDAFGSNFWMALFEGKKKWTFYPPSDLPLLYPQYKFSLDPVFDVDLTAPPDFHRHPLFAFTSPIECILSPGELLFVPAGSPHYVQNLTKSLAISANFVDASNLDLVMGELELNALVDPRAQDLLQQFQSEHFDKEMRFS